MPKPPQQKLPGHYRAFYDERRHETYAQDYAHMRPEQHGRYNDLKRFVAAYGLQEKTCLEIGSSGGMFQDVVDDYHGTDIARSLAPFYHKDYRVAKGEKYPFEDEMFDAIWTIHVYEHVPHLQKALLEIRRLLKPGGLVYFHPAWQCRRWAADGYAVRPYGDFGLKGKCIKLSIPLRNSLLWRGPLVFVKRLYRHLRFVLGHRHATIRYRKLTPNYRVFWTSDSDACNHIDPHDAILWFVSNGFDCLSHPLHLPAFFVRNGPLVLRKQPGKPRSPDNRSEPPK